MDPFVKRQEPPVEIDHRNVDGGAVDVLESS
jgi:hypothetical protein